MKRCIKCKGRLVRGTKEESHRLAERRFVTEVPSMSCTGCGEVYVDSASLERVELAVAAHVAKQGPATGETFRFMRKALSLRGSELGALLDVTAETISRWENGQRNVHRTAWVALGSMVLEKMQGSTSTMDRLQMLTHDELAPNVVRLAV